MSSNLQRKAVSPAMSRLGWVEVGAHPGAVLSAIAELVYVDASLCVHGGVRHPDNLYPEVNTGITEQLEE